MAGKSSDRPRPAGLITRIRALAAHSECVIMTHHALERMEERDILDIDVFRILRHGRMVGEIEKGKKDGEWVVTLVDRIKGTREAGVVTAVINQRMLIIVTVEWEDVR
jgi:hypothetical protein